MASRPSGAPIDTPTMADRDRWRLSLEAVVEIESVFDAISAKLLVGTSERLAVLEGVGGGRCRGMGRYHGSQKADVLARSEWSRQHGRYASEVEVESCRSLDICLTCLVCKPRGC